MILYLKTISCDTWWISSRYFPYIKRFVHEITQGILKNETIVGLNIFFFECPVSSYVS
jgi:hypothetical protein